MRFLRYSSVLLLFLCSASAIAELGPTTVVATVNGKPVTAGEVESLLAGAPPEQQKQLRADRRLFIRQYALVSKLAEDAVKEELQNKSPFKEKLEWSRMQVLLQSAIANQANKLREAGNNGNGLDSKMGEWMDKLRDEAEATYESQDYFSEDAEAAAKVAEETVVAKVNGKPVTAGEVAMMLRGAAPKVRENFRKSRRQFFQEYAMMLRLVEEAEANKLASVSPYKEQLAWVRNNVLSQARLDDYTNSINIGPAEEKEYYEANQDRFTIARVKVLYVSFGAGDSVGAEVDGKKILSEDEAKAKIERIRKEIEHGADFVEMVKLHSEDETSKAKDGDLGTIHRTEHVPEHIKDAVFALAAGQVSEPVRQPNGFYLFRTEENRTQSLDEVRQTLNQEAKTFKFNEWFATVREGIVFTIENEEYFAKAEKQ
jgi:peptidyl-prolyl cis-trans isomerase C